MLALNEFEVQYDCVAAAHRGNASNCRKGLMVVERTITVGFHSNFGAFNPTYESQNSVIN